MNPLGVHYLPTHKSQKHYDFIHAMQPGILKLCGASTPDVQYIADCYQSAPNALMYLRNVARSEQHDFLWRDPVGAARQHVAEWHADIQERWRQGQERGLSMPDIDQIRILGINEPVVELFPRAEDMSNYDHWLAMVAERAPLLDSYMVEFGQEANRHGYGTGLGNIPSGQPANLKPGEYATFGWFPKTRKFLESTRGLNAYACHEYWRAETGPEGHADWHAWRFTHLDVDCDIDILECGVDQRITDQDPNGNRGWTGHMDASAYIDQHRRYLARARQDSRFRCATPYTLDGDKMWESFWVEYCMDEMVSLSNEVRSTVPETPDNSPHTIHLPQVNNGESPTEPEPTALPPEPQPDDNWERTIAYVLSEEGDFQNHPADPGNYYQGKLIGTKYGISARVWGGQYDIPNLTIEQAKQIYFTHYWQKSGANQQPWPACLLVMDTDVLHGVNTSRSWFGNGSINAMALAAKRLRIYTDSENWKEFGAGWTNRVARLLLEASK